MSDTENHTDDVTLIEPIGVDLSINDGAPFQIVGVDYVVISIVAANNGSLASLGISGIATKKSDEMLHSNKAVAIPIMHRDTIVIHIRRLDKNDSFSEKYDYLSGIKKNAVRRAQEVDMDKAYSNWRLTITDGMDCPLFATSYPHENIQAIGSWSVGDDHIRMKVESISAQKDGSTNGVQWSQKAFKAGASITIKVEGYN
jgi:hypothetical protein